MGRAGTYGRFRAVGPIAAALAGISEMSGLPEPAMPAGWGYSYLDWIGAYSFATAMLAALYHRDETGGASGSTPRSAKPGIFIAGTAILDWSANGRAWQPLRQPLAVQAGRAARRSIRARATTAGSRSPASPTTQWRALAEVAGHGEWLDDPRFATLGARLAHQDDLDALVDGLDAASRTPTS